MSARVYTVTSGKGGVGKTTTTANLAAALAMRGQRVVAIDADIGLRNLDVVMGLENRIVYDLVDVVEGRCRLRQAMVRDKRLADLYLLPAAQTRDKTAVQPEQMVEVCNSLRPDFDFILVDSPAGIEQGFRNAIAPADEALVVTTPEVSAVRDADRIIGLIEAAEKESMRLIINRLRLQMVRREDMLSVEDVLDVVATLLRTWGQFAIDLGSMDVAAVQEQFEEWARHALVIAPAPGSAEGASARAWSVSLGICRSAATAPTAPPTSRSPPASTAPKATRSVSSSTAPKARSSSAPTRTASSTT